MLVFLGIILLIGLFFLIIGVIDSHRFRVVEETVQLEKLEKDCRFVLLSDLHNHIYGEDNKPILEAIELANPDFVIIAGDLVTSKERESIKPGVELAKAISKKYPVYYGMGNHETKIRTFSSFGDTFKQLQAELASDNMHILINECMDIIPYNIRITGLELPRFYYAKFKKQILPERTLNRMLGESENGFCNILIAHNPDYFPEYANWGADLVLSGHVHGGIMRLPLLGGVISPSYVIFPEYDGGIFHKGNATMLLGRGLGAHTIPLRFFNPGELYIVNCLRKE